MARGRAARAPPDPARLGGCVPRSRQPERALRRGCQRRVPAPHSTAPPTAHDRHAGSPGRARVLSAPAPWQTGDSPVNPCAATPLPSPASLPPGPDRLNRGTVPPFSQTQQQSSQSRSVNRLQPRTSSCGPTPTRAPRRAGRPPLVIERPRRSPTRPQITRTPPSPAPPRRPPRACGRGRRSGAQTPPSPPAARPRAAAARAARWRCAR